MFATGDKLSMLFWGLNPPKEDGIQSKQKPCWFLVYCYHDVSSISFWNNPKIFLFSNINIQKHNWRTGDPCYINYFATSREYKPYFWCAENLWTWRGGCDLSFLPPTPEPTSLSQWAPNHFPPSSWSVQSGYFSCGEPTQPGDWPAKQSWWETNGGKKERGKKKCFEVTDLRLMILRLETFRFCWLNCTATKFLHVLVSFPRSWFFTLWHPGLLVLGCRLWCTEGCGCGARSREGKFQKTSNQVRQHDIE